MKLGVVAPAFRDDPEVTLDVAVRADGLDIAGVFLFDHIWPMGQPDRPALSCFPMLGAVAQVTSRVAVGTLVARVGLVPDAMLAHEFATLQRIAEGAAGESRLIAGLGTGDSHSRDENEAVGVEFASVAERVASLDAVCRDVAVLGVTTWIGGRSGAVRAVAARRASALNVWGVDAAALGVEAADVRRRAGDRVIDVTWGGQVLIGSSPADARRRLGSFGGRPGLVHGTADEVAGQLRELEAAGASWAVCASLDLGVDPESLDLLNEVAILLA